MLFGNFLPQRLLAFFNANGIKLCVPYFPRGCLPLLNCGSFWLYQSDSKCSKKPTYSSIIVTEFSHFGTWELMSVIRNLSKVTVEHSAAPPWHLMPQLNICCTMCCWSVTPGRRWPPCSLFAFPLYLRCCSASCCAGRSQLQNNQLAFS